MKDLKATQLQIEWADAVWDSLWGGRHEHMIAQHELHEYFQKMMFRHVDEFKFFHDDSGRLRIPIDLNTSFMTILWASPDDFKWEERDRSWYLKNPNSGSTFKIVKN